MNHVQDVPKRLKEVGFDFDYYTKQMLIDATGMASRIKPEIFSKKPLLQISALRKYHDNDS